MDAGSKSSSKTRSPILLRADLLINYLLSVLIRDGQLHAGLFRRDVLDIFSTRCAPQPTPPTHRPQFRPIRSCPIINASTQGRLSKIPIGIVPGMSLFIYLTSSDELSLRLRWRRRVHFTMGKSALLPCSLLERSSQGRVRRGRFNGFRSNFFIIYLFDGLFGHISCRLSI
jgi:hypothetical protein